MRALVIELDLDEGILVNLYSSLRELRSDEGMRNLFDDGLVKGCKIECADRRITGEQIKDYTRLLQIIDENDSEIETLMGAQ